jgi:hypothetical protein
VKCQALRPSPRSKAAKESQFDDAAFPRVALRQVAQRLVECHQIHGALARYDSCLIKRQQVLASALCRLMPSRVLHQDLPHQLRGDAEEVGSVLPLNSRLVDELQVDLIDQGGAGQSVVKTLASQRAPGGSPEFTVDNRKEFRER